MALENLARRSVILAAAGAVALPALASMKSVPLAPTMGPEESQAIATVRAWAAALVAKNVDQAAALMDEAVQYRDDPFQTDLKKGRTMAVADLKILLHGLVAISFEEIYAIGSSKNDVLVLARRIDTVDLKGKRIDLKVGAYYRVRNGKILEWLDTPLSNMPPPPAGARPRGA